MKPRSRPAMPEVPVDDHGRIGISEAQRLGSLDERARLKNAQLAERARMTEEGIPRNTVIFDALEDSDRYDGGMEANRGFGDLKVVVKRIMPTRDDVGSFPTHLCPDFGALTDFVRRHAWNGEASEYTWILKRRGMNLATGELRFDRSPRHMLMAERGEWPEPLPNAARPSFANVAGRPETPPAPEPVVDLPRDREPRREARSYDRFEDRDRDRDDRERESDFDRSEREYQERERRYNRSPAPRAPAPEPPQPQRGVDPVMDRLFDELADQRRQAAEDRRVFEERLAAMMDQREPPREREPVREREVVREAPPGPPDPVAGFAQMGQAFKTMQEVSGIMGMVPASQVADLERKMEAAKLKMQMDQLQEKIDALKNPPPPPTTAGATGAAAAAPAAAEKEEEEKEETAEDAMKRRTRQAGPLTFIDKEDGETDWVETVAASFPAILGLMQGMQEKKKADIVAELKLIQDSNAAMERQAKVAREYTAAMDAMKERGYEPPPAQEETSGSAASGDVQSDEPFAPTSLGEEEQEAAPAP